MKLNLPTLLIMLFLSGWIQLTAQLRLPSVLSSHMVLQQKSNAKLWGWCNPGEKIVVSTGWDSVAYRTTGSAGALWSLSLKTPAAGGPYNITIKGNTTIVLSDVLIGEVWVCSGQSNMEMNVRWGLPYAAEAAAANNPRIRFFQVPKATAAFPQDDVPAQWTACTPETMQSFSAAGYFFGLRLQQELGVPVGLINSSWGGTPAEVWTPQAAVEQDTALNRAAHQLQPAAGWPINPGAAFNGMIHPLLNFGIAGAIWYQGESNTTTASTYTPLFTTMIGAWRQAWQKEFPFYYVQIAPYTYGNVNIGALLREAQTATLPYPHTGMVVTSDLVNDVKDIHPKMKKEVGIRLANWALADHYGKNGIAYQSPLYKSMAVEKDKIRISFEHAEKGLMTKSGTPNSFWIAGEDRHFLPAEARIDRNTVLVWNKAVKSPVAVRFAFNNTDEPNLFSKDSLPVNLFRTDRWPVDTSAAKPR